MTIATPGLWIAGRCTLGLALTAACAACAPFEIVTLEGNHITYRRPFTDAAAAEVRRSAERLCDVSPVIR